MQPSTGCTDAISVPAQGDGEQARDGRKYTMKSIWVSGLVTTTAISDAADVQDMGGYYFALVLDMQANGATIVSENVYINPATAGDSMLPKPLRNLQQSNRFRILASKYIPPGGAYAANDHATNSSTMSLSNQVSARVSLGWKGSINCNTKGTAADIASATDCAIHLLAYTANTGLTPVFNGKSRLRFMG